MAEAVVPLHGIINTDTEELTGLTYPGGGADRYPAGDANSFYAEWSKSADTYYSAIAAERLEAFEVRPWKAKQAVGLHGARLPSGWYVWGTSSGYKIARCVVPGVTGNTEPVWPTSTVDDYHTLPATYEIVDGTVTWRLFNITCISSSTVAGVQGNNAGVGTQADPKSDPRAILTGLQSGRAVALSRGVKFDQYSNNFARLYIDRPASGDASIVPPYYRSVISYGTGAAPLINATGLRFGIRLAYSTTSRINGYITIQDIAVSSPVVNGVGGADNTAECGAIWGICDTANPSTYTTLDTSVHVFNCVVSDFHPSVATRTETGLDVNGIKLTGANNSLYGCRVNNQWDDAYWLIGSNLSMCHCASYNGGYATTVYPNRERGDGAQINSSLLKGNGNTPTAGLYFLYNRITKYTARKHGLIINPEVSTMDANLRSLRSTGYIIAFNSVEVGTDDPLMCIPAAYLSGFSGEVFNNVFISKYSGTSLGTAIHLFAGVQFYNNVVSVSSRGQSRAVEAGYATGSGSDGTWTSDSRQSSIYNNTFLVNGGETSDCFGVFNWGTGNVIDVYNNLVIGVGKNSAYCAIRAGASTRVGYNAWTNCASGMFSGGAGAVLLGGDVDGTAVSLRIKSDSVYPTPVSPLSMAGYALGYQPMFDAIGRRRQSKPTIGAIEADRVV